MANYVSMLTIAYSSHLLHLASYPDVAYIFSHVFNHYRDALALSLFQLLSSASHHGDRPFDVSKFSAHIYYIQFFNSSTPAMTSRHMALGQIANGIKA